MTPILNASSTACPLGGGMMDDAAIESTLRDRGGIASEGTDLVPRWMPRTTKRPELARGGCSGLWSTHADEPMMVATRDARPGGTCADAERQPSVPGTDSSCNGASGCSGGTSTRSRCRPTITMCDSTTVASSGEMPGERNGSAYELSSGRGGRSMAHERTPLRGLLSGGMQAVYRGIDRSGTVDPASYAAF